MEIDKSWIAKPRNTTEYLNGLEKFLDFAFANSSIRDAIKCPCPKCGFRKWHKRDIVRDHLICKPFPKNYKIWNFHGETIAQQSPTSVDIVQGDIRPHNPMEEMINEAFGFSRQYDPESTTSQQRVGRDETLHENLHEESTEKSRDFYELLKDGNEELYEGCKKYLKLEFLLKLYHIKCLCRVSDKAMTMILELLKDAFQDAKIPKSFYEAKKVINKLGLGYTQIHACPNNCMLYWGEDAEREECKKCLTSRWKSNNKGHGDGMSTRERKSKNKLAKILRYFLLKPRLQRLFMCSKTAEQMRWHASENSKDGMLRHPRDADAWKSFDRRHSEFASDPRNVRLGLATDGFNPFGTMSTSYSLWPVIMIPYNLPPWICMKYSSFMLSMVIPGPRMPGNNIDVYLQPLIKELKELWIEGVETHDSSTNENFTMRAALMWTISDFPGLGTLSGWNTHTGFACPVCNFDTEPCRLPFSKKWCFMGHHRFLRRNHRFRLNRIRFDGNTEERSPPTRLTGSEILKQLENIDTSFGCAPKSNDEAIGSKRYRRKNMKDDEVQQWRKRSIFLELPYWEFNLLHHNLDVMHIEKNVCDNVLYTLLNEKNKTKDNQKARKDLQVMGIRHDLWPQDNGKCALASFTIPKSKKDQFLKMLKNVKVPDGYASYISRCVDLEHKKIFGLKSHDCHIIMEQLLPLAIRQVLPNHAAAVLIEFCSFFRQICEKCHNLADLVKLQDRIALTLCHLEMLFPPSFFTIMVHLTIHLVDEIKLGGPVHYRLMYSIERYLGYLKSMVRNRAQPEGSITKGYLAEEALNFCSRYFEEIETRLNRSRRVNDNPHSTMTPEVSSLFPQSGRPVGAATRFTLTPLEKLQAHRYVLLNCPAIQSYIDEFRDHIRRSSRGRRPSNTEIEKRVNKEFVDWFPRRIMNPDTTSSIPTEIKFLAQGPIPDARRFTGYNINGFKFRTLARENGLKTQNSGVFLTPNTSCVASSIDRNIKQADLPYYGKLEDIIELNYHGYFMVILFKCQWANTTRERDFRRDTWHFNSVNFSRLIHTGEREEHDPYIEASQAQLVYYVEDEVNEGWSIAVHLQPRDTYDMGEDHEDEVYDNVPFQQQDLEQ